MLSRAPDVALEPTGVARRATAVDLHDERADLAEHFPGLTLPERLRGAVRKRHVEYLVGRWCAREALAALSPALVDVHVASRDDRMPTWPDGYVGAITHTQGYAAAVVAESAAWRALGCDTEQRFTLDRARRIESFFACPGELQTLAARSALAEADLATLVFSAKESVYKCLYPSVGRFFGFHCAALIEAADGHFVAVLTERLSAEFDAGYALHGRYALTDAHLHTSIALAR